MAKISPSAVGRLLEEISWEGNARRYRKGGPGFENVLTAEAFQALDFLPRARFMRRVLESLGGDASEAAKLLAGEVEKLTFSLLPGDIFLAGGPRSRIQLTVQPDAVIESPSVYCLLEAKRIKPGSFQPQQLAREYLAAVQEAGSRRPMLLLVLPGPPPVSVKGHGRLPIQDAVARWLEPVLSRCEHEFASSAELIRDVPSVIAYITWPALAKTIRGALDDFTCRDESLRASVSRVANALLGAIEWHS